MARRDTTVAARPSPTPTPARAPAALTTPAKPAPKQTNKIAAAKTGAAAPARGLAKPAAAKKAKLITPPPKPATVTLKLPAAELSECRGLPKRDAEAFAADLIGRLVQQIKGGAKVRLAGLGVIEIKDRPARTARNPATGAAVQVEASRRIVFRVAKDLKDAI